MQATLARAVEELRRQQMFDEYVSRVFEARTAVAQGLADISSLAEQIAAAQAAIPALEQLVRTYQAALGQHNVDVLSYYTEEKSVILSGV